MLQISPAKRQALTNQNEKVTEKMFKKNNCIVQKLDVDNAIRRVDFLITKGNKQFLCEVKTILSAGYTKDGSHLASIYENPKLMIGNKAFEYDGLKKGKETIRDALTQYKEFIKNEPKYGKLPFVIALFPEFYSDSFNLLPERFQSEISAIIQIERDRAQKDFAWKLPLKKLEEVIRGVLKVKTPPPSKEWKVLRNKNARRPIDMNLL